MGFDLTGTPSGGGAAIAPAPESAVWSGPHGGNSACSTRYRQATTDDPGATYVDGSGAIAALSGLETDAQWDSFRAEFPTAVPGYLHGMLYVSWGNSYATVSDMYCSNATSTKAYHEYSSYVYSNGYFYLKKLLLPKVSTGGMWYIPFAKPIPFYLGLRVSYDNGSCYMYFLYTLRGAL